MQNNEGGKSKEEKSKSLENIKNQWCSFQVKQSEVLKVSIDSIKKFFQKKL